jgi:hypothetical protein
LVSHLVCEAHVIVQDDLFVSAGKSYVDIDGLVKSVFGIDVLRVFFAILFFGFSIY